VEVLEVMEDQLDLITVITAVQAEPAVDKVQPVQAVQLDIILVHINQVMRHSQQVVVAVLQVPLLQEIHLLLG
jgi:hypothetical protein